MNWLKSKLSVARSQPWWPQRKWWAAAITGAIIYGLGALGVDLGPVLHDAGNAIGVKLPDPQALAAILGALLAHYVARN